MPDTLANKPFVAAERVQVLEAPDQVLSTMTKEGKRRWMYPTPSKGRYYYRRLVFGWALILLFVALPIVRIGGRPAVLLDLLHREFTFFGVTFYPTDTFLLLLLLVGTLLSVILFTALLGRVWCGWACPQTVYMEFLYRPIERWIEGKEHVRQRRDAGPWTFDKAWRKAAKTAIFAVLSLLLAHTFVAYFVGWERLLHWMQQPPTEHWGYFVMMTLTAGLVLFDFGYFREQMCTITCPYARIQSVLLDPDSLIVSYDPSRGEPRGKGKKREDLGDCIDCFACVRTCPTGIDIRDGLQMECIACTACVDACDEIMDRVGQPRGLIRYTSEHALAGAPTRRVRPRTVLYSLLLLGITTAFITLIATRGAYDINVGRSAGQPFMELPDGQVANRLRFRVRNQTPKATAFTIEAVTPASAEVKVVGTQPVTLAPQEMTRLEAWVVVPADGFRDGTLDGRFRLRFTDGTTEEVAFPLLGPSE